MKLVCSLRRSTHLAALRTHRHDLDESPATWRTTPPSPHRHSSSARDAVALIHQTSRAALARSTLLSKLTLAAAYAANTGIVDDPPHGQAVKETTARPSNRPPHKPWTPNMSTHTPTTILTQDTVPSLNLVK
ncbi:MAG: hypothetical protein IPQ14_17535 [Candidatus Microthrix sp.]|nr:hypothetical protein [Candidatus Microthrix sp.]